jgi:hypothetical protein
MKIVMITGHQKSGTTAMMRALGADSSFATINEHRDSPLYLNWNLRPEKEIRHILHGIGHPIITKPVNETRYRGIADIFEEYKEYDLHIVFMYRDPINTYFSNMMLRIKNELLQRKDSQLSIRFPHPSEWCQSWNRRMTTVLDALPMYDHQITLVRYEDVVSDIDVFNEICDRVGVKGKPLFRDDNNGGRLYLPGKTQQQIINFTVNTLKDLNTARTFVSYIGIPT